MAIAIGPIQRVAGFELNALRAVGVLGDEFEKVRVPRSGTPIYDTNGTLLFYRLSLRRGQTHTGYADIGVNEALAEPLMAVGMGAIWDEAALVKKGVAMARKAHRGLKYNKVRFVAYSFPKIALQFLLGGTEVLMLELHSWAKVPPARTKGPKKFEPSNFERWSLLDNLPKKVHGSRVRSFKKRVGLWNVRNLQRIDPSLVLKKRLQIKDFIVKPCDTREIHYSPRPADHHPCYELRGQQTNVWCVAASVEMLMNFYRYQYTQPRLAKELGLGTCARPNGLPYGDEYKVVNTIKKLSSKTLEATAIPNPGWSTFQKEIQANRPLISFVPGHSRTVAGYTYCRITLAHLIPFRGLLVYDPWPPTDCAHPEDGGVITKWENFATHTYRYAFTAVLKHV